LRRILLRLPRPAPLPTFRGADGSAGPAEALGDFLGAKESVAHGLERSES